MCYAGFRNPRGGGYACGGDVIHAGACGLEIQGDASLFDPLVGLIYACIQHYFEPIMLRASQGKR